jgi:hypothetical protein
MRLNKPNILYFLLIAAASCITPFEPEIRPSQISKYVVNGRVSDNGEQAVTVSLSSSVDDPQFIPVPGCSVIIRDDLGKEYFFAETTPGSYSGIIDSSSLVAGRAFMARIATPDGTLIESDFDTVKACPEVDSVYYLRRQLNSNSLNPVDGIQFYLDVDGAGTGSRFFRWELRETWKYEVPYPKEWYYDGTVHHIFPPDYSRKICWYDLPVKEIYTLSTSGLVAGRYERLPLNFVDNYSSSRLLYGYSLLVNQLSLSEAAYSYWDQVRINSSTSGSLYQKQPFAINGNFHNITSPGNLVLGFFEASSVRSKRVFVREVKDLEIKYVQNCSANSLRKGFIELTKDDYPAFLYGDEHGFSLTVLGIECVDCVWLGGTNIKPDFWPW